MTDTILSLFKYFTISFCTLNCYGKISGYRYSARHYAAINFCALLLGVASVFTKNYFKAAIPAVILVGAVIFYCLVTQIPHIYRVIYGIISLALSFTLLIISVIVAYPLSCLLNLISKNENVNIWIYSLFVYALQLTLFFVLFNIKRFKKYLSSVEKTDMDTVLILSIIVLIAASLLNMGTAYSKTVSILVVVTFSTGLLLVFGIKKHISYVYTKRVNMRNEEILQSTVKKLEQDIYFLKKDNEKMSAVIHRDNKILPTMQRAVKKVVEKSADDNQKELLATLKKLYAERTALLDDGTDKDFQSTGDLQVDSAVAYLSQKAQSVGVDFFFFFTGDPIVYPDGRGVEDDFLTLLLDLGENAVISAKNADMKLVKMGICFRHGDLSLNVYDSGNKFDERVKRSIGKRRFTTHKTDGGSGIGLMTAYELLRKYSASFVVNENIVSDEFQKCVSVVFNDTFAVRFE